MRAAWAVPVIGLLGACFTKPELMTGAEIDAPAIDAPPDAPFVQRSCGDTPFGAMTMLDELAGFTIGEPTLTGDKLEMYFVEQVGSDYELHYATRDSTSQMFTPRIRVDFEPVADPRTQDPSITEDGRLLMYRRGLRIYYVTRTTGAWSTPAPVLGLGTEDINALDLSWDGLTLYFLNGGNQLRVATRTDRAAAFTIVPIGLGPNFTFPTISSDGLELFYYDGAGISRSTRTSLTTSFPAGTNVFVEGSDPDLSPDGQTLVAATSNQEGIQIATRVCPPL